MNRTRQATGKVDSDIPMKYKEMVVAEKRSRQNSVASQVIRPLSGVVVLNGSSTTLKKMPAREMSGVIPLANDDDGDFESTKLNLSDGMKPKKGATLPR